MKKWTPIIIVFVFLGMAGILFYCLQSERQAPLAADPAPAVTANPAPSTPPAAKTAENMPANVPPTSVASISQQEPLQAAAPSAGPDVKTATLSPAMQPPTEPVFCEAESEPASSQPDVIKVFPIDKSGIYWLPDDVKVVVAVYCDGQPAEYVLVQGGTAVDVFYAKQNSNVAALVLK